MGLIRPPQDSIARWVGRYRQKFVAQSRQSMTVVTKDDNKHVQSSVDPSKQAHCSFHQRRVQAKLDVCPFPLLQSQGCYGHPRYPAAHVISGLERELQPIIASPQTSFAPRDTVALACATTRTAMLGRVNSKRGLVVVGRTTAVRACQAPVGSFFLRCLPAGRRPNKERERGEKKKCFFFW